MRLGISWIFTEETAQQSGINKEVYESYIMYLKTKPKKQNNPKKKDVIEYLSPQTIQSYTRHLRAILNFFINERGYTDYFKIVLPKAEERVKEPYSKEEMQILLEKPNVKTCRFSEYRNWVLANYLAGTANRISTAINLKISDLNFNEEEILLRAVKNKKPYVIPLNGYLKKILLEYLGYRGGEPDDPVFCPENDSKKHLTVNGIKSVMSKYNKRKGITKTSSHLYRNYFSKHYLLKGRCTYEFEIHSRT